MHSLVLQIHRNHAWHDAMRLVFRHPEEGLAGGCSYTYEQNYLVDMLEHMGSRLDKAV